MSLKLKKKKNEKVDVNTEIRHLGVLMENMNDKIVLIAEGHMGLERSIGKLDERMERMEGRMDKMEGRMYKIETDVIDIKSGQSQILEYLFRIENEIQDLKKDLEENYEKKGHDKKWRELIEERLEKIEKMLTQKTFSGASIASDGNRIKGCKKTRH